MLKSADYEPTEQERAELSRERFLTSHRAIAACSREFGRLADEIVGRAGALRRELMIEEEPDLRLTPERCIVQIGPVALTIAWLRGALDSLTDGRLLIIAWRGTITRRRFSEAPQRVKQSQVAQTAAAVWEEAFIASADSEATWEWQCEADPSRRYGSADLAEWCIEQARAAFQLQASVAS
jgi:hypothetical protein